MPAALASTAPVLRLPTTDGKVTLAGPPIPPELPGSYTNTVTPTITAHNLSIPLSRFNSYLYQPVLPPSGPLEQLTSSLNKFWPNAINPLSKFTPEPLQFRQPNFDLSPSSPSKITQETIQNFAKSLQQFTTQRAWPQGHQFPPIVFLPESTFNTICKETNTAHKYNIAQLNTGEILVRYGALSKTKQQYHALAAVQQKLILHAYNLDAVTPAYLDTTYKNKHKLAPGIWVNRHEELEYTLLPQGLDYLIPDTLNTPKDPDMYSAFGYLAEKSNPSLVGFADLLSQVTYQLHKLKIDLSKGGSIVSMGAGAITDRHLFSKLLPLFKMIAIDPKYDSPDAKQLAKENLKQEDLLFTSNAQSFSKQLDAYCTKKKPGFIVLRNITDFKSKNNKVWKEFFHKAYGLLKERRAIGILVTTSTRAGFINIKETLNDVTESNNYFNYNDAALKVRGFTQDPRDPNQNKLVYATGPDAWYILLTHNNT